MDKGEIMWFAILKVDMDFENFLQALGNVGLEIKRDGNQVIISGRNAKMFYYMPNSSELTSRRQEITIELANMTETGRIAAIDKIVNHVGGTAATAEMSREVLDAIVENTTYARITHGDLLVLTPDWIANGPSLKHDEGFRSIVMKIADPQFCVQYQCASGKRSKRLCILQTSQTMEDNFISIIAQAKTLEDWGGLWKDGIMPDEDENGNPLRTCG